MANETVRAGGNELVIFGNRDVDGEEAAEIIDGGPSHDQSENEQDQPDDIKDPWIRQSSLRKGSVQKKAAQMLRPITVQRSGRVKRSFPVARDFERLVSARASSDASRIALRTLTLGNFIAGGLDQ